MSGIKGNSIKVLVLTAICELPFAYFSANYADLLGAPGSWVNNVITSPYIFLGKAFAMSFIFTWVIGAVWLTAACFVCQKVLLKRGEEPKHACFTSLLALNTLMVFVECAIFFALRLWGRLGQISW